MRGEIDRNQYCISDCYCQGMCMIHALTKAKSCTNKTDCTYRHRKWPTPEQFKEEYSEECDPDLPIWWKDIEDMDWLLDKYKRVENIMGINAITGINTWMVVACTPWGKPPNDWRPE